MKMKRGITNVAAGLVLAAMLLLTYLDSSANANKAKATFEKKCGCSKTIGCSARHRTIREGRKNVGQTGRSAVSTELPTWTRGGGTLRGEAVLMQ